jgi:hypothetical protein
MGGEMNPSPNVTRFALRYDLHVVRLNNHGGVRQGHPLGEPAAEGPVIVAAPSTAAGFMRSTEHHGALGPQTDVGDLRPVA